MKTTISSLDKVLFISVSFTMILLLMRIIRTHELTYVFYIWNFFLAIIPLISSNRLVTQNRFGLKAICYLTLWLLFLPNAPYLVTDLFHFTPREGCPEWFDLILVSSASWNGIAIGIISLLQVETFLNKFFKRKWIQLIMLCFIILSGYGVYLGRFLRFNSWDVIANPFGLANYIKNSFRHPHQNISTWAFTVIFSFLFGIIFFTIKGLNANRPGTFKTYE